MPEIETKPSRGSKIGVTYVAANGNKMPNLGEKRVKFKTKDGMNSSIMFQVTKVKKPLAAVSRITEKGNWVCFGPDEAYIMTWPLVVRQRWSSTMVPTASTLSTSPTRFSAGRTAREYAPADSMQVHKTL